MLSYCLKGTKKNKKQKTKKPKKTESINSRVKIKN